MKDLVDRLTTEFPLPDVAEPSGMTGVDLIAKERRRQQAEEGWTPEHDDEHAGGQLALAAAVYATPGERRTMERRTSALLGDFTRGDTTWEQPRGFPRLSAPLLTGFGEVSPMTEPTLPGTIPGLLHVAGL